jgi:flagellar protein FliO/FliZ
MSDSVVYIMTFVLLISLAVLAVWIAQQSFGTGSGLKIFQAKPRRTGVVEATSVDGRRRLILIRRDNVEHLIMTGGPVDVVIETGIPVRQPALVNGLGEVLTRAENGLDSGRQGFHSGDGVLSLGHEPN